MGICAAKDTSTSQIDAALRDLDEREHRDPPIKVLFLGETCHSALAACPPGQCCGQCKHVGVVLLDWDGR